MAIVKKSFKEDGILVGKEIKQATEAISIMENGKEKIIAPQPIRYVVKVVSSGEIEDKDGMITPSYAEFTLNSGTVLVNNPNAKNATQEDIALFNSLKYLDDVIVKLEMSTSGTFKMVGVAKAK